MARISKSYSDSELRDILRYISIKIKQSRKHLNISQVELSKLCNVSNTTISDIEKDNINDLRLSTIFEIAKGLKISALELLNPSLMQLSMIDQERFLKAKDLINKITIP